MGTLLTQCSYRVRFLTSYGHIQIVSTTCCSRASATPLPNHKPSPTPIAAPGILGESENCPTTPKTAQLCSDHPERYTASRITCLCMPVIAIGCADPNNVGIFAVPAIISSLQSVHQTIPRAVLIAQLNMVCFADISISHMIPHAMRPLLPSFCLINSIIVILSNN